MPKESKRAILRRWQIPDTIRRLRYKQPLEKGIYWYWLSRVIRQRDLDLYSACISCGKLVESIDELDCGHYAAAGNCGPRLLFEPYNLNAECKRCNAWDEGHLIGYRKGLVHRYGTGVVHIVEELYERDKHYPYKEKPVPASFYETRIQQLIEAYNSHDYAILDEWTIVDLEHVQRLPSGARPATKTSTSSPSSSPKNGETTRSESGLQIVQSVTANSGDSVTIHSPIYTTTDQKRLDEIAKDMRGTWFNQDIQTLTDSTLGTKSNEKRNTLKPSLKRGNGPKE